MNETVIYTSPDQRYSLIQAGAVGAPLNVNCVLPDGSHTVVPTADDVGLYLDGATGAFVPKSEVDATTAAYNTYAAANPKAPPKDVWAAIEAAPAAPAPAPVAIAENLVPPPAIVGGGTPSQPPAVTVPTVPAPDTPTFKPIIAESIAPAAPAVAPHVVDPTPQPVTLTAAEHAQSITLAQRIEGAIQGLDNWVLRDMTALRALLKHF